MKNGIYEFRTKEHLFQEEAIEEDKVFEVISGFQAIGTMEVSLFTKMMFVFPAIAFVLMFLALFAYFRVFIVY